MRIAAAVFVIASIVGGCTAVPTRNDKGGAAVATTYDHELFAFLDQAEARMGRRPRTSFVAVTMEPRFGMYVEKCLERILFVSERNYPAEIRGMRGKVQLTTVIAPEGDVVFIEITKSSGNVFLDQAAGQLVRMAAPFDPFPSIIRADTDLLAITRTFTFASAKDPMSNEPLWKPRLNVE